MENRKKIDSFLYRSNLCFITLAVILSYVQIRILNIIFVLMIHGICLGTVEVSDEPVTRAPSNPYHPIVDPDTDALSHISSRPQIPPFETKMPETILQLLKQHIHHGLDAYKNVKPKKPWVMQRSKDLQNGSTSLKK